MDLNKIYDEINEYFPKINKDMVDDIVERFDELADLYYSNFDVNDKESNKINNSLLTKRILSNKLCNTPNSIDTILSFVTAMCKFVYWYNEEPEKIFDHSRIWDYLICANRKFNLKKKLFDPMKNKYIYEHEMWIISNDDLDEVYYEFMEIDFEYIIDKYFKKQT